MNEQMNCKLPRPRAPSSGFQCARHRLVAQRLRYHQSVPVSFYPLPYFLTLPSMPLTAVHANAVLWLLHAEMRAPAPTAVCRSSTPDPGTCILQTLPGLCPACPCFLEPLVLLPPFLSSGSWRLMGKLWGLWEAQPALPLPVLILAPYTPVTLTIVNFFSLSPWTVSSLRAQAAEYSVCLAPSTAGTHALCSLVD